jgi:hypothetical protein
VLPANDHAANMFRLVFPGTTPSAIKNVPREYGQLQPGKGEIGIHLCHRSFGQFADLIQ